MTAQDRVNEAAAMLLVGDALLGIMSPSSHCLVWRAGPPGWRTMIEWFAARPGLVRAFALLELGAGLWLAQRELSRAADEESLGSAELPPAV